MVTDLQNLFQTIDELQPDDLKQLYRYIAENHIQFVGLHSHLDSAWMSGDFRDELPDDFWLGKTF
jgi:hypothetical protein